MAAAALACALTPAAASAAPHPAKTPSAKVLWRSYPLQATPAPSVSSASPAPPARRVAATHRVRRDGSGGESWIAAVLAVAAIALAAGALWATLRRSAPPEPLPEEESAGPHPPDPSVAWTAEIDWAENGGRAAFHVTAEHPGRPPTTLAATQPIPWPPRDSDTINAVSGAVEALAAELLAHGWRELPAGDAWYARRFAWDPPARTRRFTQQPHPTITEAP